MASTNLLYQFKKLLTFWLGCPSFMNWNPHLRYKIFRNSFILSSREWGLLFHLVSVEIHLLFPFIYSNLLSFFLILRTENEDVCRFEIWFYQSNSPLINLHFITYCFQILFVLTIMIDIHLLYISCYNWIVN